MSARGNFDRRFALGVYDSGGSYSTDRSFWEETVFGNGRGLQGFPLNVYLNYWLGDMPIAQTRALLDVLQSRRMMYLQTGNAFGWGSWKRIHFSIASQEYVQAFAQHPAALGYYIADEPTLSVLTETEEHRRQLKAWDQNGLTFAALMAGYAGQNPTEPTRTDPARWINAADVLGVDPYPLYGPEPAQGYTHFSVADYVSKLRAAVPVGRPVWAVLQFFKGTSDSRLPTVDEMRAHAVMAIVEGATGIFWWDIGVNGIRKGASPATIATYMGHLKALVTELAGLEPLLLSQSADDMLINSTAFADPVAGRIAQLQHNIAVEWLYSRKEWYQEEIEALQRGDLSRSGGMLTRAAKVRTRSLVIPGKLGGVFAYNYTNEWQDVTLGVPLFNLGWKDRIEPYGARIYLITPDLVIRELSTGQQYPVRPIGNTPPIVLTPQPPAPATSQPKPQPTPAPAPSPSERFIVSFLGPHSGQHVSGSQTVGIGIPAEFWAHPKRVRLHVGGVDILNASTPTGTAWWPQWDTRRSPNGPAVLTAEVTIDGQTATATLPVVVAN